MRSDRRNFLRLGVCGLSAATVWGRNAAASAPSGRAKNVLVLFEQGGLSHIDTFDPKPDAAAEHRSPFKPIATNVPGMFVSELLPKTARRMDRIALVRSMMQPKSGIGNSHPKGSQYVFSGEAPDGPEEMPDIGSVAAMVGPKGASHLPSNVLIPGTSEQAETSRIGFLPPSYKVFKTGGSPADPNWRVQNLGLIGGIDENRFRDRRDLLSRLDVGIGGGERVKDVKALQSLRAQAADMLTNPATKAAFDLSTESPALRQAYGTGHRGQCYLLGRKLLEAGVRFVTVDCREPARSWLDGKPKEYPGGGNMNWDHHDAIYSTHHTNIPKGGPGAGRYGIGTWPMMGSLDQAYSALLDDLDDRGLLADTLVCLVTEFGRTPKLNDREGRDHWIHAFTFAFAGAGVRGGQVVGETDRDGGFVVSSNAYTIEDYAATLYEKLGIDREKPLYTPADRPIFLAKKGSPIPELF